jgi:hypothetical protein
MSYEQTRAVNASLIKECLKSPFHGWNYLYGARETSASMELGTLVHALVLQPKVALDQFLIIGKGERSAKYEAEANGRKIVRAQVLEEATAIANAVKDCPAAMSELANAITEVEMFFDVNGTPCKARIDGYTPDGTLIEFKTSNELYARDFCSTIIRYDYQTQCAFYKAALKANNIDVKRVVIMQATTESPYLTKVYELDDLFIEAGNRRIDRVFETAAKILKGYKPEQDKTAFKLEFPEWAKEAL